MVTARCPQCGREYTFDDSRANSTEACAQCGFAFTIPPAGAQQESQRAHGAQPHGQQSPYGAPPPNYYAPYPPGPYPPYPYPRPQPTNGNAIAGMVLGIASIAVMFLGFILGPLAIYFSNKAIREIDASGAPSGSSRGFASAGKICGIIGTIVSIVVVLLYIVMTVVFFAMFRENMH